MSLSCLRAGSAMVALLVTSISLNGANSAAEKFKSLPKFTGGSLATPPQQRKPWTPPDTKLPANLLSAVRLLFDLGLADPRGCEYREIEVVVGSVWGYDAGKMKTHGWVLPQKAGSAQAFAVSWAGTVYPVISVGPKVDLKADVEALLRSDEPLRVKAPGDPFASRWDSATPEASSISELNMMSIKVALLLRLNETQLTEKFWEAWRAVKVANEEDLDAEYPFRMLATDWSWALFDRAICAHMRGDDSLALADARMLTNARPKLDAEQARHGYRVRYIYFLTPLPELLVDQERRAKQGPRQTIFDIGLTNFPFKTERINRLIADLEEVMEPQMGQPGGVMLGENSIIKALVAEGEDAVEPLLKCAEQDQRLTRSVSFGRDFHRDRTILTVQRAAMTALSQMLKVRYDTAAGYRAHWQKHKAEPMIERWYRTLADDQADHKEWMQAAENIMGRKAGNSVYYWRFSQPPDATNHYTFAGENLRSKHDPSVADLLVKRGLQIAPNSFRSSRDCWTFQDAADLGLMLAQWEPKTAAPGLAKIIQHCPALYARRETWGSGCAVVPQRFAALAVAMADSGDTSGLDLYAQWVRERKPEDVRDGLPSALSPLGRFPNHPSIREASVKLFRPENGDWLKTGRPHDDLLGSELPRNETFRTLILRALEDKTDWGTIILEGDNRFSYRNKGGASGGGMLKPDTFAPPPGESVAYRVCDDVAHRLKRIKGIPRLELYWPLDKRDASLAAIVKFLKENGERLQIDPQPWYGGGR